MVWKDPVIYVEQVIKMLQRALIIKIYTMYEKTETLNVFCGVYTLGNLDSNMYNENT